MNRLILAVALCASILSRASEAEGQNPSAGIVLNFVDTDVRAVIQTLTPHLDRTVVFGELGGARISLQSPRPEPPSNLVPLLRTALGTRNLELVEEGPTYVVRLKAPPSPVVIQGPAAGGAGGEVRVIRLRHARAADVAATVNALYGQSSALGEIGARPATLAGGLRENRNAAHADPIAPNPAAPVGSGSFQGEVTIVPDARTNSLLVRASPNDYQLIEFAVAQVDIRPLQVVIQVTIAEVRRESDFSYALEAAINAPQRVRGSQNTTVDGSTAGPGEQNRTDLVIHAGGIGGVDLDLTLRAGVRHGAVTVLSRPVIFAANNERAEIMVGKQRPFVQLRRSGESNTVDQVVQYMDVGTRLSVLPTISGDGYVQLEVTQEVNTATTETGLLDAPVISTRTIETSLLVHDGQTAVLGGLSEAIRERSSSGIPFLSDIPIIGGIFGSKLRSGNNTELFIFLTPRVVRDDAEMDSTTEDIRRNGARAGRMSRKLPLILPRPKPERAPSQPETPPASPAPSPRRENE